MMRIITGNARGIKLNTLEGTATRPTAEVVKEGVFSAIQFELEGTKVLDLFAGSGQLGLEALSRGASTAVFVDCAADAVEIIKQNAKKTGLQAGARIIKCEYGEYIKNCSRLGESFDFIFVDSPYADRIAAEVAKRLFKAGLVNPCGVVICETDQADLEFPDEVEARLESKRVYRYGKTYVYILRSKAG